MNKIEKLLNELCPDGVEFKELGEVCEFQYWKWHTIPKDGGNFPVYWCNGIVGQHNEYNNENSPIIWHIGTAWIVVWGEWKHFVTYNGTICRPLNWDLLSRYLYYNLLILNLPSLVKGAQPFLSYWTLKKLKIPIPPIEIQKEIVKILDTFTLLEAELEAELEARKKQYEYYRDDLLSFWDDDVEWKELGEVCLNIFSWKNKERAENWKYPIFWSTWVIWKTNQYIYNTEQILVARVWANAWLIHIWKWEYDVSDNTLIIQNKDEIKLKFLYYLLINMNINQYAKWWWQPLITAWLLKSLKIPVPSLKTTRNCCNSW